MAEPPGEIADVELTPAAEHEWELLRELVDFADRLVLAFVFADRFPVRVLRARMERLARQGGLPFRLLLCDEPEALRAWALGQILQTETDHEVLWFEAFGSEEKLRAAWSFAAQRWNEHREPLRRSPLRALIVAAPTWAKVVIREAAPDLWSITNLVIEPRARGIVLSDHRALSGLQRRPRVGTPAEQRLAERAVEEALALPASQEGRFRALLDALWQANQAGATEAAIRAASSTDLTGEALARRAKTVVLNMKVHGWLEAFSLATGLTRLGNDLVELRRLPHALQVVGITIELAQRLGEHYKRSGTYVHSSALMTASRLRQLAGQHDDALAASREVLELDRSGGPPETPEEAIRLAGSVNLHATTLLEAGKPLEGLASLDEAYGILSEVPASHLDPDGWHLLSIILHNQFLALSRLGRAEDAVRTARAWVELQRGPAPNDVEEADLVRSLSSLSSCLAAVGGLDEAIDVGSAALEAAMELDRERYPAATNSVRALLERLATLLQAAHLPPDSNPTFLTAQKLLAEHGISVP
jgi:tetratricopeptide (TPR) repeat protein